MLRFGITWLVGVGAAVLIALLLLNRLPKAERPAVADEKCEEVCTEPDTGKKPRLVYPQTDRQ